MSAPNVSDGAVTPEWCMKAAEAVVARVAIHGYPQTPNDTYNELAAIIARHCPVGCAANEVGAGERVKELEAERDKWKGHYETTVVEWRSMQRTLAIMCSRHPDDKKLADALARITELEAENERLENLTFSVHTCHDKCPRKACVDGRRIRELEAEVARLKNQPVHEHCCEEIADLRSRLVDEKRKLARSVQLSLAENDIAKDLRAQLAISGNEVIRLNGLLRVAHTERNDALRSTSAPAYNEEEVRMKIAGILLSTNIIKDTTDKILALFTPAPTAPVGDGALVEEARHLADEFEKAFCNLDHLPQRKIARAVKLLRALTVPTGSVKEGA